MKSSINDLHDFYSTADIKIPFKIKKQIDLAITLEKDKLILNNISLNIECDDKFEITGAKHAFANILMILFDNSIYQLEMNNVKQAKIDINVKKENEHMEIRFRDNAGGIKVQPIEKVFEVNYSTKGKNGCGLGLTLAKKLVTNALSGSVLVHNVEAGAEFVIII